MRPVGAIDNVFLLLEKRHQPMHVGGLMLFRPSDPDFAMRFAERARAATVAQPPFNQRLTRKLGIWFWEDDPDFDVEAHFYHLSLPKPGRIRELLALISQLHGALLDRAQPLWEAYLIEGVEGGRVALYFKIHHALVDGVASMRILQRAMSTDADARELPMPWAMPPRSRETAAPEMSLVHLGALASEQVASIPTAVREVFKAFRARNEPDHVSTAQAPRCILNQRVTASRRFAAQSWELDRMRTVSKTHGVTINDVALAMCGSALRRYLMELRPDGLALPDKPLVAMVPISIRRDDSDHGNQVAMVLATLATDLADPVERLHAVSRSVKTTKDRFAKMSQAEIISYVSTAMAVPGLNIATGVAPQRQAFNVIISNVPGPKERLHFDGAPLEGLYPVSIVLDGQALNITLTSNVDKMEFGLTACRRTVPRMQRLLGHLEDALKELGG